MVGNPARGVEAEHAGDPGRPVIVLVGHGFAEGRFRASGELLSH
jgi:hypothetical protein